MPLSEIDRKLIDRCLGREPGAWNDFVDRYVGLIYHVIQHVAHARSRVVSQADLEDIAAEILLKVVDDDYDILRRYKGHQLTADLLDRDRPANVRQGNGEAAARGRTQPRQRPS